MRKLSTGEPCAGEPHARFGGRGESGKGLFSTPIGYMDVLRLPSLALDTRFPAGMTMLQPTFFLTLATVQTLPGDFARHLPSQGFQLTQNARLYASLYCGH